MIKKNTLDPIKLIKYFNLINHNLVYNNKAINRYKKDNFEISPDKANNLQKLKKSISQVKNCTLKKNAKNFVYIVHSILSVNLIAFPVSIPLPIFCNEQQAYLKSGIRKYQK